MKSLTELHSHHQSKVCDKYQIYLKEYQQICEYFKKKPIALLEIAIQNGRPFEILSKYFKNRQNFIGCDTNLKCEQLEFLDERILLIIRDKCQCRKARIERHHIAYAVLVWIKLSGLAKKSKTTINTMKRGLLTELFKLEFRSSSARFSSLESKSHKFHHVQNKLAFEQVLLVKGVGA